MEQPTTRNPETDSDVVVELVRFVIAQPRETWGEILHVLEIIHRLKAIEEENGTCQSCSS